MGFSGERLRTWRKEKGMSAASLGELICVQQPQITRIENGTRKPNIDLLPAIAKALECSIDDFFPEMDDCKTARACGSDDLDDLDFGGETK